MRKGRWWMRQSAFLMRKGGPSSTMFRYIDHSESTCGSKHRSCRPIIASFWSTFFGFQNRTFCASCL
jgi:hypothetical protein